MNHDEVAVRQRYRSVIDRAHLVKVTRVYIRGGRLNVEYDIVADSENRYAPGTHGSVLSMTDFAELYRPA
jgi:hypothetical protein